MIIISAEDATPVQTECSPAGFPQEAAQAPQAESAERLLRQQTEQL